MIRHWALRLGRELGAGDALRRLGLDCWAPFPLGVPVLVEGLVGARQHNGRRAVVVGWSMAKGRCEVTLSEGPDPQFPSLTGPQTIRVKPQNLRLEFAEGSSVVIEGLVGAKQYNGKHGLVRGWNVAKGRCDVELLEGGEVLGVKPLNLRSGAEDEQLAEIPKTG